jgi:hypothetical protein
LAIANGQTQLQKALGTLFKKRDKPAQPKLALCITKACENSVY